MGLPGAGPALTGAAVRAVLFDMDGVIRHWRYTGSALGEELAGLPRGAIGEVAFAVPEFALSQVGAVTHREWADAIGRALVARYGPGADAAVEPWFGYRGDLDAEMVALLADVRRRVPVAIVSNATDSLRGDLAEFGIEVDALVCSAEVGLVKPAAEIYRLAAAAVGAAPGECLFTDDLPGNVEGAVAAGLRAVRFTGRDALVAALREAGLDLG